MVKSLQNKVKEDFGIIEGYHKCWYARARANIMLYGDCVDQFKRVYDYANAVRKHNPSSTALVKVLTSIERLLFQSMFVCLKTVWDGFLAGCIPVIRMDGCHLTKEYFGVCLTIVGKDGNINI